MARITFENKDGIAVLKIKGAFMDSFKEFYKSIENYIQECEENKVTPKIIIDLEKVPSVSATGLGALISVHTRIKKLKGSMTLVNISEKVSSLLTITKLISIFTVAFSMKEALKTLK